MDTASTWREDRFRHQRENPSFSSSLLDAIYRSIDEPNGGKKEETEVIFYRETMEKKQNNGGCSSASSMQEEMPSLQRACMIERWMSYEKVMRRKSMADYDHLKSRKMLNSSSSSSDSSSGGRFSSSESESIYGHSSSTRSSSTSTKTTNNFAMQRPKPIRTSISSLDHADYHHNNHDHKPKHEGMNSFVKTKSKALKIYGDLKKVKQPISPGGRLASFINSLFTTSNTKKAKLSSSSKGYDHHHHHHHHHHQEATPSTCSSASSFSRSCLSKTPSSSGGKLSTNNNGAKRSVRFYPVSVIVDEDCRPCGHKNVYGNEENSVAAASAANDKDQLKFHVMKENCRVEEVARELLKKYQKKKKEAEQIASEEEECYGGDDDDDVESCASSDLFELDNLSAIGIERYGEELPVYETTHLDTNRALANGLIL